MARASGLMSRFRISWIQMWGKCWKVIRTSISLAGVQFLWQRKFLKFGTSISSLTSRFRIQFYTNTWYYCKDMSGKCYKAENSSKLKLMCQYDTKSTNTWSYCRYTAWGKFKVENSSKEPVWHKKWLGPSRWPNSNKIGGSILKPSVSALRPEQGSEMSRRDTGKFYNGVSKSESSGHLTLTLLHRKLRVGFASRLCHDWRCSIDPRLERVDLRKLERGESRECELGNNKFDWLL